MRIAVTGATGFLGRSIVANLAGRGEQLRCLYRPESDRGGFEASDEQIEWIAGGLGEPGTEVTLVEGCDAVVHAALDRPGGRFIGGEGDLIPFVTVNLLGTLRLIEASSAAGVGRFVFISTCAVYDQILDDRPLDEAHPAWPSSHYGAHKAAIEAFVSSHGFGEGFPICSLRPTGIYGIARPIERSKWYGLVEKVVAGGSVECRRGGKEVHVEDVARAAAILLDAPADSVRGLAFNCCDGPVSEYDVAMLARSLSGSVAEVVGAPYRPKHQIDTSRLASMGMNYGGSELLGATVARLVDAARGTFVGD